MDLIRENIEYTQLFTEKATDNIVREEFVIPDTHPDVSKILMVDGKVDISRKDIYQDKVRVEGQIEYSVLYVNEDENEEVHCATYISHFTSNLDTDYTDSEMYCDAECYVDYLECNIVNERKVCVEGVIQLKCEVYEKKVFDIVNHIEDDGEIQLAKNTIEIDKIVHELIEELNSESNIYVSGDMPEINKIIKCDVMLHDQEIRVLEDVAKMCVRAKVKVLYKSLEDNRICCVEEDVYIEKECEREGIHSYMNCYAEFKIMNVDYYIRENDNGESKIVNLTLGVMCDCKVMTKANVDVIEDAYVPRKELLMDKVEHSVNVINNQKYDSVIIKEDIDLNELEYDKAKEIIFNKADVCILDKKVLEDKALVEGLINVSILYKSYEGAMCAMKEQIPFTCYVDTPGSNIDMDCAVKIYLEGIECVIEGTCIAVKGIIKVYSKVNYMSTREFLVDVSVGENEIPLKDASMFIYVVQNGDTLWKIAKCYQTTVDMLKAVNKLESDDIKANCKLIIPGRAVI